MTPAKAEGADAMTRIITRVLDLIRDDPELRAACIALLVETAAAQREKAAWYARRSP